MQLRIKNAQDPMLEAQMRESIALAAQAPARAWGLRPSYIACGPIFATQSKDMPWIAQGLNNLRYWAGVLPVPVVGIAGIGAGNMAEVAAQGVAGAAVIAAITQTADPDASCRHLMAEFDRGQARARSGVPVRPRPTLSAHPFGQASIQCLSRVG